ncbi:MAG: hypothetical protein IBJ10_03085 [Phycisphaerales bacterium]|nr:hypothetical protein [Phycisphaerales bacterium]
MKPFIRLLALALGVGIAAQSVMLWNATGRAAWTRFYDAERAAEEAAAAGGSLADLFEGTGIHDDAGGAPEALPNGFALGLLPSGPDHHAISVLTLAGPGALIVLWSFGGLLFGRRKARACCAAKHQVSVER